MRIKKGYIYLTIIALAIYGYISYKNSKEREHYSTIVNSMITDIRREDYFAIHSKLSNNLKSKISIEDIKNYCQSLKLNKQSSFDLKHIKKEDENITLSGIVTTDKKQQELYTTLQESNDTYTILSQKIGKSELKAKKVSFPIVTTTKTKAAN